MSATRLTSRSARAVPAPTASSAAFTVAILALVTLAFAVLVLAVLALAPPAGALTLPAPAPPSVAGGYSDSLAVKSDGTLWAWGAGERGQLGQGDTLPHEIPVQIGSAANWAQVAIGEAPAVLALRQDGTLWAWGDNQSGQLGLGTYTNVEPVPVRVGTDVDWALVAAGGAHTMAIKQNGELWGWGSNWMGELGLGAYVGGNTPQRVGALNWRVVACGYQHSVAVREDGSLWAWGLNTSGQLGQGAADDARHGDPLRVGTRSDWVSVGAGWDTTYAIRADGTLWACGGNWGGKLGDGTETQRNSLVRIGTATDWVRVAGANNYAAGLKSDGTLWGWGFNNVGELGASGLGGLTLPHRISTRSDWAVTEPGAYHLLALSSTDQFASCGGNYHGQTGIGYATNRCLPEQVGTVGGWSTVDAGLGHGAGVRSDGTLWTWGRNWQGELGLGDIAFGSVNAPQQVGAAADWASVSCGDNTNGGFTAAVRTDGTLWTWGANDVGQLGQGDVDARFSPTQVGTATDWQGAVCSDGVGDVGRGLFGAGSLVDFTLGLRSDGSLYAWGENSRGQLGRGDTTDRRTAGLVAMPAGETVRTVAAGDDYAVAVATSGKLFAWGGNADAQLGLGYADAVRPVLSPSQVGSATDWIAAACGSGREGSHTMGIRQGATPGQGSLWAWGDNSAGQLGLGDYADRTAPTQVGSASDWVAVACGSSFGDDYTLARKADGSLWAFGQNFRGQLGRGDYVAHPFPVAITAVSAPLNVPPPLLQWTAMACGSNSFAILADGSMWAWGDNSWGQLGLGDPKVNTSTTVFQLIEFTDTTPPVVEAAASTAPAAPPLAAAHAGDAPRGLTERWYRKAVTVSLTASDDSAGVSRVQYSLTGGIGWKTARSVKIGRNGRNEVLYRGLDRVGNVSAVGARTVLIDTVRPKPNAPYTVRVKRYRTATIRYSVADIKAMPAVKVTFVVKNSAGRTVKSWSRSGKATNTGLRESFACKLARGTYRYYVYATDLAGNTQLKPASNRLVVY